MAISKVNAEAAMIVLKRFAPESDLAMLDTSAEYNNLPRIGSDTNTAFPAMQINLASSVSFDTCGSK